MEEIKEITEDSDIFKRTKGPEILTMFIGIFTLCFVLFFIYLSKDIDGWVLLYITVVLGITGSYAFFNGLFNYKEIKEEKESE